MRFCNKLQELRKFSGYGFNEFWKEAHITNVYLSQLENGSKIPPPPDRQLKFIEIFEERKKISENDKLKFYDLAAKERDELPADIQLVKNKKQIIKSIRNVIKGEIK